MRALRSLFSRSSTAAPTVHDINRLRASYANHRDDQLRQIVHETRTMPDVIAATAVMASRALGLEMHDEQLLAARALADGCIVEMQTGEGKTLAAVPAVVWHARAHRGVHVLTANDYLAHRDAEWMRATYERLGLTVASIQQGMSTSDRRAAYRADVTYATANEVGFDYLRDGLALHEHELVHRDFEDVTAIVDEADSILIDEARIPLVIAGGAAERSDWPIQADRAVRELAPGHHYALEPGGRNILLTPAGVRHVEHAFGVSNLFDAHQLEAHAAVQDALHAHVLLRKDVDYVVHGGAVLSVDEFKGRIVEERRWPAGLQTALECKEGVRLKTQGRVLGSITVQNLIGMYGHVSGMTGTAVTQASEFREIYELNVVSIPPHRPVVRVDHADRLFPTKADKEAAVVDEIRTVHAMGRPVLVGTASVEESERLSRRLGDLAHHVLNARHEAKEAEIVARAGVRGAVTISTNMAGRGVDIVLGEGVAALGGLHVIGTNRHDSRRIDHQLRGRAGRQGDPGSSQFFVSREDPLFLKHVADDPDVEPDQVQRMAEGSNLDVRLFLRKYESVIEGQRLTLRDRRDAVLLDEMEAGSSVAMEAGSSVAMEAGSSVTMEAGSLDPAIKRQATLEVIDDLWSDYLAAIAELRAGTPWLSLGGKDPHRTFLSEVHGMFEQMTGSIEGEVMTRMVESGSSQLTGRQRGATWTYLTTDEPFGPMTLRIMRTLVRMWRGTK
jgi:preprotein translocase subunit SecA